MTRATPRSLRQPSTDEVLMALERAERQSPQHPVAGVDLSDLARHLALAWPQSARRLRARLGVLEDAGLVRASVAHQTSLWQVTTAGRRRIAQVRRAGLVCLPESPQHRAWRESVEGAERQLMNLRALVQHALGEAQATLTSDEAAGSDLWLRLADELQDRCRRLGSAVYCVGEWPEPAEDRPDVDDYSGPDDRTLRPDELGTRRARRVGRRSAWKRRPPWEIKY